MRTSQVSCGRRGNCFGSVGNDSGNGDSGNDYVSAGPQGDFFVYVSHRTVFRSLSGRVTLDRAQRGAIRTGFGDVGMGPVSAFSW